VAQTTFGYFLDEGRGVAKNPAEAVRWYRKAAEQGFAMAQFNLATMYAEGVGVAKDEAEAMRWYRKAAEQGDAEAAQALEQRRGKKKARWPWTR
jgi:TPR repeat protein